MKSNLTDITLVFDRSGSMQQRREDAEGPGLVITTDGLENSSKEFTRIQIKEMIEHQQTKYGWHPFIGEGDRFRESG